MKELINREDRTPVYHQIVDWISRQIREGAWPPHYKLPAEEGLSEQLGVARGTVRQALQELEGAGFIYRLHGKGTFVSSGVIEHNLGADHLSFLEQLVKSRISFKASILEKKISEALPPFSSLLGLKERCDTIFSIKRLRTVGPDNFMLSENHVACNRYPEIEREDFSRHSLYSVLESRYKVRLAWGRRIFEARVAEADVADHLGISLGSPVFFAQQLAYDADNRCIDCAYLWLRGDKMKLSVTVKRNPASDLDIL